MPRIAWTWSSARPAPGPRVSVVTLAVFFALAACLWANAAVNMYRFNLAVALVGSIPLVVALARVVTFSVRLRGAHPTPPATAASQHS